MRILVTGGCGFIGTNLIRHLLAETAHHVINVDKLTYAANPKSLEDCSLEEGGAGGRYRFVRADLADASAVKDLFATHDPDAILHLAAESHVDRSIDSPSDFVQANVVGTFHLLHHSLDHYDRLASERKKQFRFLHVSTDEVYGSLGQQGLFSESSPYDPHSPYAATKAASDHLARAWCTTYELPVIVTNCSNNYGPYQFPEKLIPLMIISALRESPLPVYGKGLNVRDWIYVEDHVRALMTVLERGVPGETYNIGADNELRNIDLVHQLCDILDELRPRTCGASHAELVTFVTDRPGHDSRYAIDSSKIQNELNWKPEHHPEPSLRKTVQWYLDHQSWWQDILDGTYRLERLGNKEREQPS